MRTTWRLFLRVFLPVSTALVGGALTYGYLELQPKLTELRSQETTRAKLGLGALANNIEPVTRNLMYLSRHSALRSAVGQPTPENLSHLARDFSNFVHSEQIYNQVRWIDETGMERVRIDLIDGKVAVIPADQLQNKANRYYFKDAIKLNPGEVFISPMDLNVERDQIELPYKPMIRFATPVTDQQGTKRGIVIVNYFASVMLRAFGKATFEQGMVLNSMGYWLKSPQAADEWGFMFKRPDLSLVVRSPQAWKLIAGSDQGQVTLDDGLWTWETVYPLLTAPTAGSAAPETEGPSEQAMKDSPYFWKSVTYQTSPTLSSIRQAIALKVFGVFSLFLALVALGSWKLARAWRLLADSEEKYQTVANFTYDWETWLSPKGDLLFSSNSCEKITGYPADAFKANPNLLLQITHPDDQALMANHLQHDLEKDGGCELSFRIILPNGEVRWIEHACLPAYGKSHEFLGRRASNRDITDRKIAEAQIRQLAYFDTLTGLPNRRMLYDRLHLALAQAKRHERLMALMFIDLDYFKKVNDTLGHEVGDKLLKEIAKRLERCIRSGDTVARVGGDEFIVVLAEITAHEDCVQVAQKILSGTADPVCIEGKVLNVSVSIGIAVYPGQADEDVQSLMKNADVAMYEAKSAGRNTYAVFDNAQT